MQLLKWYVEGLAASGIRRRFSTASPSGEAPKAGAPYHVSVWNRKEFAAKPGPRVRHLASRCRISPGKIRPLARAPRRRLPENSVRHAGCSGARACRSPTASRSSPACSCPCSTRRSRPRPTRFRSTRVRLPRPGDGHPPDRLVAPPPNPFGSTRSCRVKAAPRTDAALAAFVWAHSPDLAAARARYASAHADLVRARLLPNPVAQLAVNTIPIGPTNPPGLDRLTEVPNASVSISELFELGKRGPRATALREAARGGRARRARAAPHPHPRAAREGRGDCRRRAPRERARARLPPTPRSSPGCRPTAPASAMRRGSTPTAPSSSG